VPNEELSLAEGAIEAWDLDEAQGYYRRLIETLASHYGFSLETPWKKLSKRLREKLMTGDPTFELELEVPIVARARGRRRRKSVERIVRPFDGVLGDLERRLEQGVGRAQSTLSQFRSERICPECGGARLRIEARHVRIGDRSLPELTSLAISDVIAFFEALELPSNLARIAERIETELRERLGFLEQVGLGYLSLDRPAATLSGGEAQRIRLATQIGAQLIGVLYILDEPSVGLHPRDNERLLESLESLRDLGNSLIVVEHDEATIRRADHVIDVGPGAGIHGGHIVAQGSPSALEAISQSTRVPASTADTSSPRAAPLPSKRYPNRRPGNFSPAVDESSPHHVGNPRART